jgi:dTDP-4-dehydrorhamnose 3,5-epimerase
VIFKKTPLAGAFVIKLQKLKDERGFFARSYCQKEFKDHGLIPKIVQANFSFNKKKGTLRGMHYQIFPYEEAKLIQCTRGALYDVIIDLRKDSPTYKKWFGLELTANNYTMLYVPESFAHGFYTLEDNTEATYMVSQFYTPGSERGIRWDDPAFNIQWPLKPEVISSKDAKWGDYTD